MICSRERHVTNGIRVREHVDVFEMEAEPYKWGVGGWLPTHDPTSAGNAY